MVPSLRYALLAAALPFFAPLHAQETTGTLPFSLRMGWDDSDVPTVTASYFDAEAVAREDAERDRSGVLQYYGRFVDVSATPETHGRWYTLPNGDRVWKLRVTSPGAKALELFFEDHFMPEGAEMHVYDDSRSQVLGGYTQRHVQPDGSFSLEMVYGDACTVEYYEPVAVRGQGRIRLTKAIHGYRWVGGIASDPCEVDVNCSEGAGWEAQRDAVVRIRVVVGAGSGWCSGALVNNTAQDCKPYVLSAMHCILGSTAANFNQYQFRFRYQRNCGSGTAPTNFNITGCVKRADSNDNGGDNGSDFVLLELNSAPPATMTPYWAGWNAGTTAATSGKGIHHPAADVKKISTYTSNLTNAGWGALNTHWRVTWVATTNGHGVTEGGSSGSPIFDQNKRIVGTLTGGGSCCTVNGCGSNTGPNVPDFYGKMSYHWTLNPNSASQKLKVWLDPANTGATVLDGSYNPCGSAGLAELERASSPLVFPNPGRDRVTVRFPEGVAMADRLEVTDVSGRTVLSERPPMPGTAVIDVAGWAPGSYLVTVVAAGVRHAAARFLVEGR